MNEDEFFKKCDEAKEKYADFESKIKKVEQKVLGCISTEYDLNKEAMYTKFCNENHPPSPMFEYIRAEYLNLIIARKAYVKEGKERLKAERLQAKAQKSIPEDNPKLVEIPVTH